MVIQVKDMEFEKTVNAFKRFVKVNCIKYTQESVLKFLGGLK